ncbi:hypothetical protein [Bradyrhizobium elkanii]|nr:hypothetical protein [Bradyrhizobium elkanii]
MSWLEIWVYFGAPATLAIGSWLYMLHGNRQIERRHAKQSQ